MADSALRDAGELICQWCGETNVATVPIYVARLDQTIRLCEFCDDITPDQE